MKVFRRVLPVILFFFAFSFCFSQNNVNIVEVRVPQSGNNTDIEGVYYYPESFGMNQKNLKKDRLFDIDGNVTPADSFYNSDSFFFSGNMDISVRQNILPLMTLKDIVEKYTAGSTIVISDYTQKIKEILNGVVDLAAISDFGAFTGVVFDKITIGAYVNGSVDSSLELPSWPFEIIIDGNMTGKTYPKYSSTDTVLNSSISYGVLGGFKGDNYALTLGVGPYGALAYSDAYRNFEFESSDTVSGTVVIDTKIYSTLNLGNLNFESLGDIASSGGWKADLSFVYGEEYPLFGVAVKDFAFSDAKLNYSSDFDIYGNFYYAITEQPTYTIDYTKKLIWSKTAATYRVKPTYSGFLNFKINDNLFLKLHGKFKDLSGYSYGGSICTFLGDAVALMADLTADSKGFFYYSAGMGLHIGMGKIDLSFGVGSKGFDFTRISSPKLGISFSANF